MTSLTLLVVAIVTYGLVRRPYLGRSVAIAGALPAGAAVVIGSTIVPAFWFAVLLGMSAGLLTRRAQFKASQPLSRADLLAILFSAVAIVVTMISPILFPGTMVLDSTSAISPLVPGRFSQSNVAQLIYLSLGISVYFYLSRSQYTRGHLVAVCSGLAVLLSFWAYLHQTNGFPFPEGFFDNSPTFAYQDNLPGGAPRVRGIFSEPQALATGCLVFIAFCGASLRSSALRSKLVFAGGIGAAIWLGSVSTSTTFFVAGAALLVLVAVFCTYRILIAQGRVPRYVAAVAPIAAVIAVALLPLAAAALGDEVTAKTSSFSYADRTSADSFGYDLVGQTLGLGTGLGSNRASSFLATMVSTVGIAGTLIFGALVLTLVRRSSASPEARPVIWSLVALLVCKFISGPDLSDPTGLMWMQLGILGFYARARGRKDAEPRGFDRGRNPPVSSQATAKSGRN